MHGSFFQYTDLFTIFTLYSVYVLCVYTDGCITSFLHVHMHVPVSIYSPQLFIYSTKNKFIYTT